MHIDDKMTLFEMYEKFYKETTELFSSFKDGISLKDVCQAASNIDEIVELIKQVESFKVVKRIK